MDIPEPIMDHPAPHSSKLKWLLIILLAATLTAAGAYYFLSFTDANDEPPSLSMDSSGLQGMLKEGKQGFLEYEAVDTATFLTIKNEKVAQHVAPTSVKAGVNYYHSDTDITVKDIVECIDPVAQRVLVAYYSPGETGQDKAYYVFPKGPFIGTETIADEAAFTIPAGRGFAVVAKEASSTYCFNNSSSKSKVAAKNPLKDGQKGWALIAAEKEELGDILNPFKGNAVNVWAQDGDNSFKKVESSITDGYKHSLKDHSLVWVKFLGADEEIAAEPEEKNFKPDAPANFVATETDGKITLKWDAAEANDGSEIKGYIVSYSLIGNSRTVSHYLNPIDASGAITALITDTTVVTPDDFVLEDNRSYNFTLIAENKDGEQSDQAKTVFKKTTLTKTELKNLRPDVPANFEVTETDGRIALEWDAAVPNDGSEIAGYIAGYHIIGEGGDPTLLNQANAAGDDAILITELFVRTPDDFVIVGGKSYEFFVVAENMDGKQSDEAKLQWEAPVAVVVPEAPETATVASKDNEIFIEWRVPTSGPTPTSYVLMYAPDTGADFDPSVNKVNLNGGTAIDATDAGAYKYTFSAEEFKAIQNGKYKAMVWSVFKEAVKPAIGTGVHWAKEPKYADFSVDLVKTVQAPASLAVESTDKQIVINWSNPTSGPTPSSYVLMYSARTTDKNELLSSKVNLNNAVSIPASDKKEYTYTFSPEEFSAIQNGDYILSVWSVFKDGAIIDWAKEPKSTEFNVNIILTPEAPEKAEMRSDEKEIAINWSIPASGPTPTSYILTYAPDTGADFDPNKNKVNLNEAKPIEGNEKGPFGYTFTEQEFKEIKNGKYKLSIWSVYKQDPKPAIGTGVHWAKESRDVEFTVDILGK